MEKKRIVVVASGRGSNFQAIIDAMHAGTCPVDCAALITDNPDAYAIERAKKAGIPVIIVNFRSFASREAYEKALLSEMLKVNPDLFVLAGYMRILGKEIIQAFSGRMINIHPALLPSFTGLHAQRQAVAHGVKVAGCTVHFVDESLDGGPIIVQHCVPVLDDDDEDTLADRILTYEHQCLPRAITLFCEGRLTVEGRKVRIR